MFSPQTTALLSAVKTRLLRKCLLEEGARVVVGLSGGADSVALTRLLRMLGYDLVALHCNFHLRGEESLRDETFVRDFCLRHTIPLHCISFDTQAISESTHRSIEMTARDLRYAWFEKMRKEVGAQGIVVAHHRDDNAETLLLNLIRGTGIKGLSGMHWKNGHILRPLLDTRREELLRFLEETGECYVTDSSNAETVYRRNKIRHAVLPLLAEINPSIDKTLAQTAQRMRDAEALQRFAVDLLLPKAVERLSDTDFNVVLPQFKVLPAPETLLFELLSPCGFSSAHCAEIFNAIEDNALGACFKSPSHEAVLSDGKLQVFALQKKVETQLLHEGSNPLPDGSAIELTRLSREALGPIPREKHTACLDADRLSGPLTLRSVRTGDRFVPFGMRGSKLVSDYLSDRKVAAAERASAKVVCNGECIAWLVNERPSELYAVSGSTKSVLLLRFMSKKE